MDASFLSGFVRGLTDEIGTRRAETRKREDAELQRRQDVLNKLYDGVLAGDVRPEHFAQIVKDQMAVGDALAGPRKRKGGKGFFTGESDLSGPLGGLLDQILSGQMDIMEGDEEGARALPATPDMGGVPAAPIPEVPGPRALQMPQGQSPFAGIDMGGSIDITPEQLPTPFNPPRFVDALQKPKVQQLSMMPPAPVPAPPRPALLVNKERRARERTVADADVRRGIADADLNERIRAIEASPLAPEQKAAAIAAAYGAPASVGTTQEGDVIPDPASPTGFARVIWGVRNGQVQETGRIPAPAPKAADDPDVIPPKEQATLRAAGVQATRYSELTPEQQRALDAYEKRQRGTIPQPPVIVSSPGAPPMTKQQVDTMLKLRGAIRNEPVYKDMADINTGYIGTRQGLSQRNGFGDIAAMNALQRMVDPGATVREGDVALMQRASSFLQRIFSEYPAARLTKGAMLPQEVRDQMLKMAEELYAVRAKNFNEDVGRIYKGQAQAAGVPFDLVASDFELPASSTTSAPKEGVIDGVPVIWVEGKGWVVK